jgi:hypothetical protein
MERRQVLLSLVGGVADLVAHIVAFGTLAEQARFFSTCSAVFAHRTYCRKELECAALHQFMVEYPYAHAGLCYFGTPKVPWPAPTLVEFICVAPILVAPDIILNWRKRLFGENVLTYKRKTRLAGKKPFRTFKKMMLRVACRGDSPHYCRGRMFNINAIFQRGVLEIVGLNYPREHLTVGGRNLYKHNLSAFFKKPFVDCMLSSDKRCYLTHIDDLPLSSFRGITAFQAYVAGKSGMISCTLGMAVLAADASKSAIPEQCVIPRVDAEDAYWDGKPMLI